MEKEFVSYEQAVALKELGFDERCLANYLFNGELEISFFRHGLDTPAPLKQQVFRWFREKYECYYDIWQYEDDLSFAFAVKIMFKRYDAEVGFKTYEEAENACIDKLIELAKQNNNEQSII